MTLISEFDEGELIAKFADLLPRGERTLLGIGDDCAQVAAPEGSFIVTTDLIVEDEHFHRAWSDPEQIGARVAAQNLADIAAMGGRCSALVVGVALRADTELDWMLSLVRGIGDRARAAGAGVVGGDMSRGPLTVLTITAIGYCEGAPVTRDGAVPGDVLAFSGRAGLSNAGLDLLLGGHVDPSLRDTAGRGVLGEALDAYRAPEPPLESGPAAAAAGAHAMMDLSDGIAKDAGRMARSSNVVIELDREALLREAAPLAGLGAVCGKDPLEWVIRGGEDHGMLAAFAPDARLPEGFRPIGRIRAVGEGEVAGLLLDGTEVTGGWDHFAGRGSQPS
ncbi:thiamine-phosphate kinase [Schaalia hyovaginalis]|uniref:Thiamine-monophosphate kinase n=1 Tax=Schaalia hyovaginalis TaxID=29316 RepID=A0A923IWV5_9ACTO|nr:thiamine-phosphate kinase [Schaalia hyovaginalis]MBB6334477.1 thiamine-monophosphate kinase [Schaalia hyovaginalis]